MTTTANLGLTQLEVGQESKELVINGNNVELDTLVQATVLSRSLATPPGSPSNGDRYIIAASPTGAWTGHATHVTVWFNGAWTFYVPKKGWISGCQDESQILWFDGTAWQVLAGATGGMATVHVTGTTQAMAVNTRYVADNAAQVVLTLPATAALGAVMEVVGRGAGGWKVAQQSGQQIYVGRRSTTVGTGGSVASGHVHDAIRLVCAIQDTTWEALGFA